MASLTWKGFSEWEARLSEWAGASEGAAKKAVYAGAGILADEIRKGLEKHRFTGDLAGSFGISRIDRDKNGDISAKIGFSGYDRAGVPNALKARVLESGTSQQRKTPFIAPAVKKVRRRALAEMEAAVRLEAEKVLSL